MAMTVFPTAWGKAVIEGYERGTALREMARAAGIYHARMGDPAPEGRGEPLELVDLGEFRRYATNCPNCGAAREPVRCSFCLTPTTSA